MKHDFKPGTRVLGHRKVGRGHTVTMTPFEGTVALMNDGRRLLVTDVWTVYPLEVFDSVEPIELEPGGTT